MTYEYDFQDIGLTEDEQKLVDFGAVKLEDLNIKIRAILNERAKQNWEPLYPFSVPMLWFKRVALPRPRQAKAKKKS